MLSSGWLLVMKAPGHFMTDAESFWRIDLTGSPGADAKEAEGAGGPGPGGQRGQNEGD